MRDEAAQAAAFINRETDGDVSSSAAGRRGKKELAACPTQSVDDEQHVDTVLPFIRGVKHPSSGCVAGKRWHTHGESSASGLTVARNDIKARSRLGTVIRVGLKGGFHWFSVPGSGGTPSD